MNKDDVLIFIKVLNDYYPNSTCSLVYSSPFELLVATILSAQCTDKQVNKVTSKLFKEFRTIEDYYNQDALEKIIYSTWFYHNKANNIAKMAIKLNTEFGWFVPKNMNELIQLPWVWRKTANVVLWNAFGLTEWIVVDTHVERVSRRIGLSKANNPIQIERDLIKIIPKNMYTKFAHQLIDHWRKLCSAKNPKCLLCPFNKSLCKQSFGK